MCNDLEARWACNDPMQEAMDYEFNARYDYAREAYGDGDDVYDAEERRAELDDYVEIDENGVPFDYADDALTVGCKVLFYGEVYTIEKDYGNGVYFIGNNDSFVDLVSAGCLDRVD